MVMLGSSRNGHLRLRQPILTNYKQASTNSTLSRTLTWHPTNAVRSAGCGGVWTSSLSPRLPNHGMTRAIRRPHYGRNLFGR
ncbi:hypothetical protein RSOL_351100 [Rhizoctonia solani AG-3 Rhs1AP]|uniref:Uncharacterized protein n=1 Tax=Rhizoctonia solani AG-3 Rhs1AP TaxID=1086054 RepID=X8J9X6_9AGAM|nr:hypothetical protein RSOL_351100 [Rhizoctonia solani AG-3 Rhs1AP]